MYKDRTDFGSAPYINYHPHTISHRLDRIELYKTVIIPLLNLVSVIFERAKKSQICLRVNMHVKRGSPSFKGVILL